jgi:magnesium chelatase family protein
MKTIILNGLDARVVEVTASAIKSTMPRFELRDPTGEMPAALRETRVRVRAAIAHLGIKLDGWVVDVVLSSDFPASGDLAVACAVLAATDIIPGGALKDVVLFGELNLTGAVRPVRGVLPALQNADKAIIPWMNRGEGRLLPGTIYAAQTLNEIVEYTDFFFVEPAKYEEKSVRKQWSEAGALDRMLRLRDVFAYTEPWTVEAFKVSSRSVPSTRDPM